MSDNDTSLFDQNTSSTQNQSSSGNQLPDEVKELVGEGKKYATTAEALKALAFSQKHIQTIENENKELRQSLDTNAKVQALLDKLEKQSASGSTESTSSGLSPEDIQNLLNETLDKRTVQQKMQDNVTTVDKSLKEMFGEKAHEEVLKKGVELGLSMEQMKKVAAESPNAFLSWFPKKATQQSSSSLESSMNTSGNLHTNSGGPQPGTYAYYNHMRKTNPSAYFTPAIQGEMVRKAQEMGADFYK